MFLAQISTPRRRSPEHDPISSTFGSIIKSRATLGFSAGIALPTATFSLHRQKHFVKFGFEFLDVETGINDLSATIGAMGFVNRFTGRSLGDFLLGLPSQLALTSLTDVDQSQRMYFSFVQDDFKVSRSLTLNLGARYEYSTPPIEKHNRLANFD